jgi:phage baseplate assembly protein W
MADEFIGSGLAFPLRVDATGGLALVSRERELEESIRLVLGTAPGERPMRPDFGCRVHDYVFAPADESTAGLIAYEVRASLLRWEPRIVVQDVQVAPDAKNPVLLWIDVHYLIGHATDPRNLVFPFYVIPGGDEPPARAALPAAEA